MTTTALIEQDLTRSIIGAFYETYNTLGYGFLESVYAGALERELLARGHRVAREYAVQVRYQGEEIGSQRVDMLVDKKVVIETKSTPILAASATRRLVNYLRGTNLEVGLLLHFGPEPKFQRAASANRAVAVPPSGCSAVAVPVASGPSA